MPSDASRSSRSFETRYGPQPARSSRTNLTAKALPRKSLGVAPVKDTHRVIPDAPAQ
jgi:hypothetical protein